MPSLYFCQPHAKNQGMLRAVLSVQECERVASRAVITYVGEEFPNPAGGEENRDFAVLSIASNETTEQWRPGYYRLDSDLMEINKALRELAR
jgi:hypothetical protein